MGDAAPQEESGREEGLFGGRELREWRSEEGGLASMLPTPATPASSATTVSCMAGAKLGTARGCQRFKSLVAVYRVRC